MTDDPLYEYQVGYYPDGIINSFDEVPTKFLIVLAEGITEARRIVADQHPEWNPGDFYCFMTGVV